MLETLLENNRLWSERETHAHPEMFARMAAGQSPEYLWIGCSDSRLPPNEIVGLGFGELFVHRNVANLAPPKDDNWRAVLQFAVDVLKVRHVLVVGHYGCGGIAAGLAGGTKGTIDKWLKPVRKLRDKHRRELNKAPKGDERVNRLCELNVRRQVANVGATDIVQAAWARNQNLQVHGLIFAISDGRLINLDCSLASPADAERLAGQI